MVSYLTGCLDEAVAGAVVKLQPLAVTHLHLRAGLLTSVWTSASENRDVCSEDVVVVYSQVTVDAAPLTLVAAVAATTVAVVTAAAVEFFLDFQGCSNATVVAAALMSLVQLAIAAVLSLPQSIHADQLAVVSMSIHVDAAADCFQAACSQVDCLVASEVTLVVTMPLLAVAMLPFPVHLLQWLHLLHA